MKKGRDWRRFNSMVDMDPVYTLRMNRITRLNGSPWPTYPQMVFYGLTGESFTIKTWGTKGYK